MPPKRSASVSVDPSSNSLTVEELEEIRNSLPPNKKLTEGRNYVRTRVTKKSDYWKCFVEYMEGESIRAECKFCNSTFGSCTIKNGTRNIKEHAEKCLLNPANKDKQSELTFRPGFVDGEEGGDGKLKFGTVNLTEVRKAIVEMIILEECSFRFAESPGFVRVMEAACPKYTCVSRFTIARDVLKLYKIEKMILKGVFRDSCQRVSITTDTWTSNQKLNYMCITAHFVDNEWKLQKRIINFCPITSHSGQAIGKGIEECHEAWGLERKLYTVTVDNATNNNTACAYLRRMIERLGGICKGKYIHMRCMAHIINLIVWDGIRDDQTSINRIRCAVKYIRNSPARFQRLKDLAKRLDIDTKSLLSQDCPTRWNSTYSMLNAACKLRVAIDGVDLPHSDKPDEMPPNEDDWVKVEKLVVFLEGFYGLTKRISGSLYMTSNKGLMEICDTLSMLNEWRENMDEKMQSMAVVMREKYDKYWGDLERMKMMVYMSVILDPHAKFEVVVVTVEDMFGKERGKSMAEEVKACANELYDEYRSKYTNMAPQSAQSSDVDLGVRGHRQMLLDKAKRLKGTIERSELQRYLDDNLGPEAEEFDALSWWALNEHRYPIVSKMARDILAIPLTTVASESAFSAGGRQVDQFRSSLNPMTVQALICTQDWIRARKRREIRDMEDNLNDLEEFEEIEEGNILFVV